MSEDNWDLNALVRSCSSTSSASSAAANKSIQDHHHVAIVNENVNINNLEKTPFDCLADLTFENDDPFCFSDLVHQQQPDYNNNLKDSLIPFNLSTSSTGLDHQPTNILPGFGPFSAPIIHPQLAPLSLPPPPLPPPPSATNTLPLSLLFDNNPQPSNQRRQLHHHLHQPLRSTQSQGSRSSRKKKSSQKKLVMQVAAENLCSDVWAWRKYGQKPIKGSPYPRNYYRCSSSKGCTARKQVERSNTDPNMFTVSYTGDHTHPRPIHRNSLAGTVRNKFPTTNSKNESDEKAINGLSPTTPLSAASMEHEAANNIENLKTDEAEMEVDDGVEIEFSGDGDEIEKEEDINLIPNMTLNEDLIKGLQQMSGGGSFGAAVSGGRPDFGDNFTNRFGSSGGAAGNKSCLF